ncbi:MAG: TIGR02677 family protein [Clostridia bacterium]|nr:TIGR02677 family protein [Clostridia bacterium]
MNVETVLMKPITETKYLTAENCWRYRAILRFFYIQYEKIKYWLYKENVYEELKSNPYFAAYTIEQCQQDLDMLTQWGNLVPVQDTSRASTIEEFKNKQFRYQLSEFAVEIERMTIKLENIRVEGASLEPTLFERIRDAVLKLPMMLEADPKTVGAWWKDFHTDFKRLNQNYQDYVRSFYSQKAEDLMKSREFIAYKDSLIEYLRDFVKGLQKNAHFIEESIRKIPEDKIRIILEKAFIYEKSIPRLDMEVSDEAIMDNIQGKWQSICDWFAPSGGHVSEASKIYDITNEIIRKITRFASQIAESRSSAANRREEYRKLCEMFLACEDIKEAHKLSAVAFGLFNTRHLRTNPERATESPNSSVYDEVPLQVEIKPKVRGYKEKSARTPIEFKTEKKEKMRAEYIKRLEEEKQVIESYINAGEIDMESLPLIPQHVRVTLLKWIGKAVSTSGKTAKTEDGRVFRLIIPQNGRRFTLRSEDGCLEMPAYKLRFEA